jgi:indolepyruvate ferredoxin oxidoreductase, alpha subunit
MDRVIIPAVARRRHPEIEARLRDVAAWAANEGFELGLNRIDWGETDVGIVTTGIGYQYARELLGSKSILKLGMSYPLPLEKIREFADAVDTLVVIEELDPFVEEQIRAAGMDVAHGKDVIPLCGELTLANVRRGLFEAGLLTEAPPETPAPVTEVDVPARLPALCPGCPHRAFFYTMSRNKRKTVISGDIGCYSMGVLPPFEAMDMLISMGASIGMAHGFKQAGGQEGIVATIGDSTFFHSGMAPLASAVYNKSKIVVAVLDNRITAMTGQQHHPGTGTTLQGAEGAHIDIAPLVRAMGVTYVEEVNAWDVNAMNKALRAAFETR